MGDEEAIARVFSWSPTLKRWAEAGAGPWRERASALAAGHRVAPDLLDPTLGRAALTTTLRSQRRGVLLTAAVAEQVAGDVTVSFPWLTACAEAWIEAAFEHAHRQICTRFHVDPEAVRLSCPFTVIGFGKLGAGEMNPSSDVDLLVAYAVDGPVPGAPGRTLHDLHDAMAREAAAILAEPHPEGFCLRVDYDLRPEGRSGALTNSLDALVAYYELYGSPLERMAWTRARPVAGDTAFGAEVIQSLCAFVYPRSGVSGALPALARVLGRLRGSARPSQKAFQVKTDRGGIRDVELVVAAHQLLHGGRHRSLRTTGTLDVVAHLSGIGAISEGEASDLSHAYRFLRRLEHLVQYREDRRTHEVPLEGPVAEALADLLESGLDAVGLRTRLEAHRERVTLVADRLFGLDETGDQARAVLTVLDRDRDPKEREAAARTLGFREVDGVLVHLDRMRTAPASPLHPRNAERFPGLDLRIAELASASIWPDGAVSFLARLSRSAVHRPLFELCREDPEVLARLVEIGAFSEVLADGLVRDPRAALEHAVTGFCGAWPDPREVMEEAIETVSGMDLDEAGEALAAFHRRHVLAVGLRDWSEEGREEEVGLALSALADACIEAALRAAFGEEARAFAVLALGRLGALEMGYRSDLDLIFLHEGPADRVLRPVHRALHLLTTRTASGAMYTLDLRLRPSGSQGPLLVESREMERYQAEEAGGAQCLGALHLRVVAGDHAWAREKVERVREIAVRRLQDPALVAEVLRIRERQHSGVAKGRKAPYDPKMEAGGMLDIETIARLGALREGLDLPVGTVQVLRALSKGRFGFEYEGLERIYRLLWRLSNRANLVLNRAVRDVPGEGPGAQRLGRAMGFGALENRASSELWDAVRRALEEGRRRYGRLLQGLGYDSVQMSGKG